MRTTLNIDEDVLAAAKSLADERRTTAGRVLSDLARKALQPTRKKNGFAIRNGVPLFPFKPGKKVITLELVNKLRDEE